MERYIQTLWSCNIALEMNGRARCRPRNHTYPASTPSRHSNKQPWKTNRQLRFVKYSSMSNKRKRKGIVSLSNCQEIKHKKGTKYKNHYIIIIQLSTSTKLNTRKAQKISFQFFSHLQILSNQTSQQGKMKKQKPNKNKKNKDHIPSTDLSQSLPDYKM